MSKSPLGRGLSSLIPNKSSETSEGNANTSLNIKPNTQIQTEGLLEVDINLISPNPYQPRTEFLQEEINNLAQSTLLRKFELFIVFQELVSVVFLIICSIFFIL